MSNRISRSTLALCGVVTLLTSGCQPTLPEQFIVITQDGDDRAVVGLVGDNVTQKTSRGSKSVYPALIRAPRETIDGHEYTGLEASGNESMEGTRIKAMARFDAATGEYIIHLDSTVPVTLVCDPDNPDSPGESKSTKYPAGKGTVRVKAKVNAE